MMVMDWLWLHNGWSTQVLWLLTGTVAALVLTLTRRRWPPSETSHRVYRAILLTGCYGAASYAAVALGSAGNLAEALTQPLRWLNSSTVFVVSHVLVAILYGFLIPSIIESRSLRDIGWQSSGLWPGVAVGAAVGTALAIVWHQVPPNLEELERLTPGLGAITTLLRAAPPWFLITCLLVAASTAWAEENMFRGHLMLALRKKGRGAASANVVQALVFAAVHPVLIAAWQGLSGYRLGGYLSLFLMGLLFGFLRWRSGTMVTSFTCHTAVNLLAFVYLHGPLVTAVLGS